MRDASARAAWLRLHAVSGQAWPPLPVSNPVCVLLPPAARQVSAVWAYQARYRVPLTKAVAGNWVLLEGVDATSERPLPLVLPALLSGPPTG